MWHSRLWAGSLARMPRWVVAPDRIRRSPVNFFSQRRCSLMLKLLNFEPRKRLRALDAHQGGAVLLLCLAAVLILMLMAWVVMDAGQVTRDKIEAQTSADVAAYSQASVKSRAMN